MGYTNFFLIDVVDAGVSSRFDMSVLVVFGITLLAEAFVMLLMKYSRFPVSFLHSLIVNVSSLLAGYLLITAAPELFAGYNITDLLILLLITIAVELPLLYLLNRTKPFVQTSVVCVLMNLITYLLFYLTVTVFHL